MELILGLILILGALALIPLGAIYYGWCLSQVWNLFMPVIFGLPVLTVTQAMGIAALLGLLKGHKYASTKNMDKSERVTMVVMGLLGPLISVGIAHIIAMFL